MCKMINHNFSGPDLLYEIKSNTNNYAININPSI